MPELPEVEVIRGQLDRVLKGKEIEKVEVLRKKSFVGDTDSLQGKRIVKICRKAKLMAVYFADWDDCLLIHLKMTGQLIFYGKSGKVVGGHPSLDWVNELPSKHTRVVIRFVGGEKLFFNDLRVFGWMRIVPVEHAKKMFGQMPLDIIDRELEWNELVKIFQKSRKAVKLLLMDQAKIGGVGNIYANDGLFLAGVLPGREGKSLSEGEIKKVFDGVREVVNLGIKYGGASASNYVDIRGMGGSYQEHFLVYKREGEGCRKCRQKIRKMKLGGRGTYYCPVCQK